MPCDTCLNEQRIASLEEDRKRNSEQHKEFYNSLQNSAVNEGERREREKSIDKSLDSIIRMIGETNAVVNEMKNRPIQQVNKVWDNLLGKGVDFIVIAVVGYIVYMLK